MMEKTEEIRPCPFCGSLGVAVVGSFVRCGTCGAAGPYGYTDAEAVERWNARLGVRLPGPVFAADGRLPEKPGSQ